MLEIVGLPWDVAAHEIARIHKCVYTKVTVDNNNLDKDILCPYTSLPRAARLP